MTQKRVKKEKKKRQCCEALKLFFQSQVDDILFILQSTLVVARVCIHVFVNSFVRIMDISNDIFFTPSVNVCVSQPHFSF